MTKQLKWRFGKLPTPDEVLKLVNDKLITKEEAREILFNEEELTERDVKSLEAEIKFLRELVDKLSENRSTIIKQIEYIKPTYIQYDWYKPYQIWCSNTGGGSSATYASALLTNAGGSGILQASNSAFSSISTF